MPFESSLRVLLPLTFVALTAALSGCTEEVPLVINEFVAENLSGATDASGELADWIELHNLSTSAVSLAGMSLSDNASDPQKHTFSGELEVPAGGYLLLYADEDVDEGSDHLRFRLDKDGEGLFLSQLLSDGGLESVDSVEFGVQTGDTSMARVPNGTGEFVDGQTPTPNAPNG